MLLKLIPFKIIVAVGLFISLNSYGQDVTDLFHTASQQFIHGKTDECKQTIATALALYPNDKRLIELRKRIKEEENKNQNNKDQQKQDQQDKKEDQKQKDQQQQQQNKNISQEDANRILEAMQNEEKELQKKLKMEKVQAQRGKTLKNW